VVACPIEFPRMRFYQIWHGRNQASAAQRWMRALLKEVADATVAGPAQEPGTS
jgi:DNA-binding transcriptional LysR family regulator